MSIASYLIKKCQDRINENITLIKEAWNHPDKLVNHSATGALADAAQGGMAGLAHFAEDYIAKNSESMILAALKATGLENKFLDAYNLAMNMMAMMLMAKNNMILRMLQECAGTCMDELAKKDAQLTKLAEKTKELYAALSSLVNGNAAWEDHYTILRQALKLVATARSDFKMVGNTFSKTDTWLAKKFDSTVVDLEKARDLLCPKHNNPAIALISQGSYTVDHYLFGVKKRDPTQTPEQKVADEAAQDKAYHKGIGQMATGLGFFGSGLSDDFPLPTTAQQWQATVAIGKLSSIVLQLMNDYAQRTQKCDLLIAAFKGGLAAISSAMPAFFKKFIMALLDDTYGRMDLLTQSMALKINGAETAINGPVNGFKTNNITVTVAAFKWIMDINLILEGYKLIPSKQLGNLSLAAGPVNVYKNCVAQLMAMNVRKSGMAQLKMKSAEEVTGDLETQMLAFLLEANNAVFGAKVRREILAVGKSILGRLELSLVADRDIYKIMKTFVDTKLPDQASLDQMFGGVMKVFKNAGLDRAAGLLMSGDYKKLFGLNGREASYVGAALAALAMLKNCFKTKAEQDKAEEIYSDLKADSDLLNISFSINFDLSIFKNLLDCLQLMDLSKLFNIQELICGLVHDIMSEGKTPSEVQAQYDKMGDMFSF